MRSIIQQDCTPTKFRRVGQGCCGSVWAAEGGAMAMKREDGGPGRSLLNDYNMHKLVLKTASQEKTSVCVPRWPNFVKNDNSWWDMNLVRFPTGYTTCNVLCAERIPPLPQDVNAADRDCLVRLYLGRRKIQNVARGGRNFFSLRNYPLHLNQAEELELPILKCAHAMAEILAMMHWTAKIDATDIEFVVGGVRTQTEITHNEYIHGILGTHSLWVLDFDCCKPLTMDDAGIEQAARGFLGNDPYLPRPAISVQAPNRALWIEFRTRYLECSQNLVTRHGGACLSLPQKFISRVVEMHEQSTERKRLALIS